ncbi:molybdopterin molybdotransferase MoeA [Hydrogenovibrio sp. 3SP14C1]|uniref:molybdopterin molybdotransferase MoeA n=1 Tax=Hydrogenovibrio sp. 3SP14C1 TaxID=3038774 RepID=UPI00241686E4|nr:gephyrin-like molybdotransferase Glp [Hydrogenovibrio sp. 3SP14C1]MDG4813274.1 molybdopterin molybdotransferase MoeA [Hydrogenovibrio sp. 3SP14C1]
MKTFDEALSYLVSQAKNSQKTETLPVEQALGKVLAKPITSGVNVPPHDNSQMDGYAINLLDLTHEDTFQISQRIPAGSEPEALELGTVARIFTGAPIPAEANAVIMQEETEQVGDKIKITAKTTRPGQNIRHTGEDIETGHVILEKGHRLRSEDLGLITSIGIGEVSVYQPLKIATFTTGDELLEPGEAPEKGKIFNANRYVLAGAIPQLGFELIDLGRVKDTLEDTIDAMKQAAKVADVVMTTGGVSVGEEDHIKPAIESLGQLDMWKVKMKPGKPLAFGDINGTPFIGLPGNPVSAFATFNLFARPYLLRKQGVKHICITPLWLEADFEWPKSNFRREFARAKLKVDEKSQKTVVELFPNQGSGVLTSAVWAEGFAVIPEDTTVKKGGKVAFYAFNDMI